MKQLLTLIAVIVATSPAVAAPRARDAAAAVVAELTGCKAIADNTARLACFDAATAKLAAATAAGDVKIIDREDIRETRRSLFGFELPHVAFFKGDDTAGDTPASIDTTIKAVGAAEYGKFTHHHGRRRGVADNRAAAARPAGRHGGPHQARRARQLFHAGGGDALRHGAADPVAPRMGETPQALNSAGLQRLNAGDAAAAAALFERAAALDPNGLPLWLNLAKARRLAGDDAGEGAALDRALALDATDLNALIRSAQRFERRGELAKATAAWSGVVAVAPPAAECAAPLAEIVEHASGLCRRAQRRLRGDDRYRTGIGAGRAAGGGAAADRRGDWRGDRAAADPCQRVRGDALPVPARRRVLRSRAFPVVRRVRGAHPGDPRRGAGAARTRRDQALCRDGAGRAAEQMDPLDGSLDWGAYHLWQYGAAIPEALRRCPATAAALATVPQADLPGRAPTAFFSILKPHTRIPPHTGVSNTRTIVHLPLVVPPGCGFRVGGETRQWVEGRPSPSTTRSSTRRGTTATNRASS